MGNQWTQLTNLNCCNAGTGDDLTEVRVNGPYSSGVSDKPLSAKSSIVADPSDRNGKNNSSTAMELGGLGTVAGASDMTKNSSSVRAGVSSSIAESSTKKVLQFRLFKSLKQATDLHKKYKVGRVLGKGSFGEVRECLNT